MSAKMIFRTACGLVITLAILLTGVSTVQAQAPANDNFADAQAITATPFEDSLYTNEATTELDEPIPDCWSSFPYPADQNYHTLWYAFTPAENGQVQGYVDSNFNLGMAVYTGTGLTNLTEVGCWRNFWDYAFNVQAGVTYYLQIGGRFGQAGWMYFSLNFSPAPPNDNFANASVILLGQSLLTNNTAAGLEAGEPAPSCVDPDYYGKTVWFAYTPSDSGAVTADSGEYWTFIAAYTGRDLGSLTEFGCRSGWYPVPLMLPLMVEAGTTYYFQVGSHYGWDSGAFTFKLYETPPPTADFWWSPGDANIFETIEFCDSTFDPVYLEITEHQWDFGDGSVTTGNCVYHQYATDGDYTVWHNIQTSDGRTDPDGVTHTISVRTHDVAITRVTAPTAARVGQTRPITVNIKNIRYPERAQIELFKSIPGGYESVGVTTQNIPVRGGNRTTAVSFNYTFIKADADMGKVTFKAVISIIDARDALPADNEAISSPPTKVQ